MKEKFSKLSNRFLKLISELKNNETFYESLTRFLALTRELKNPKFDIMKSAFYLFEENKKVMKINSQIYNKNTSIMDSIRQISSETGNILKSTKELKEKIALVMKRTRPLLNQRSELTIQFNVFYKKNYRTTIRRILRQLNRECIPLMRTSSKLYQQSTCLRLITSQLYKKNIPIRLISRKLYEDSAHMMIVATQLYTQSIVLLIVCEVFAYRKWIRAQALLLVIRIADILLDLLIEVYGYEQLGLNPYSDRQLIKIYGVSFYRIRKDSKYVKPETKTYPRAREKRNWRIWRLIKFFFTEK